MNELEVFKAELERTREFYVREYEAAEEQYRIAKAAHDIYLLAEQNYSRLLAEHVKLEAEQEQRSKTFANAA